MSTLKETAYVGRNNAIRIALSEDGTLFQTAYPNVSPDRWVLTIAATTTTTVDGVTTTTETPIVMDSDTTPTAFDWDDANSVLELRLGAFVTAPLPYTLSTLIMYAPEWPDGLVWMNPTCTPDKLLIRICDQS